MKRIAIAVVLFCFLGACKKECKTFTYVPMAPLMQEYFGNYKPGNYWVYLNRDSTKRDSMWVDSFEIRRSINPPVTCNEADVHVFYLNNNYLNPRRLLCALGTNPEDRVSFFELSDEENKPYTALSAQGTSDSFYMIPFIQNFQLQVGSTTIFPKVAKWGTIVYAPNIGIIQYTPVGTKDTFSLERFYKQ